MLARLVHFIKYHNAATVALVLLLISGSAFAASPQAREAVVNSETRVKSVDNSYIVNTNLDSFEPRVEITNVSEDETHFYVHYTLRSIGLVDAVWQDVVKEKEMKVAKAQLGERDLGLYVTEQLKQVVDRELTVLRETQQIERSQGETKKTVATVYGGLVGKFVDPKTEELPGYNPVKPPPPPVDQLPPPPPPSNNNTNQNQSPPSNTNDSGNTDTGGSGSTGGGNASGDTQPPTIQVLGNNPARVELGNTYSDLGAAVTDNVNNNLGYDVSGVSDVDTDAVGEYIVTYTATDQAGNTSQATRTVIVFDPNAPQETDDSATSTPSQGQDTTQSTSTSTTTDDQTNQSTTTPEQEPADTTAPTIELNGSATVEVEQGNTYTDAGATATDDTDGDITDQITADNPVDTSALGEYTVRYTVSDAAGNTAEATRTVTVVEPADTEAPIIELNGSASVEVEEGDAYTDAGATASDNVDGDITDQITVDNPVDTSTPGEYTVRYNVSDATGNAADEVVRTVTVTATSDSSGDSTSTSTATST